MKSSRATVSIAPRSRSERRSPRRPSSPIFASRSRRRSWSLLSGRLGGGITHPLIGPRKRRAPANPPGSRSDAGPPRKRSTPPATLSTTRRLSPPRRVRADRAGASAAAASVSGTEQCSGASRVKLQRRRRAWARNLVQQLRRGRGPVSHNATGRRGRQPPRSSHRSAAGSPCAPDPQPSGILLARNHHPASGGLGVGLASCCIRS
jgi:hypothetical protein